MAVGHVRLHTLEKWQTILRTLPMVGKAGRWQGAPHRSGFSDAWEELGRLQRNDEPAFDALENVRCERSDDQAASASRVNERLALRKEKRPRFCYRCGDLDSSSSLSKRHQW